MNITEQLKKLITNKDFIYNFRMFYYNVTKKSLKTAKQFLDALLSGEFTAEDMFLENLEHIGMSDEELYFWEDNMELFDFENYAPPENKLIKEGAWIEIRTENGYEVHFAKRAIRKLRFGELLSKSLKKSLKMSSVIKMEKERIISNIYSIRMKIILQPYEVWYYTTKTQKAYVMPYQYKIVNSEEFIKHVMENTPCVKVKNLFNAKNTEKIFYMRQRGIPKKLAMMMSNLESCYFIIDIKEGLKIFNEQFSKVILQQLKIKKDASKTTA